MSVDELLGDVEEYLTYLKEEGSAVLEMDRAVLDELGKVYQTSSASERAGSDDLHSISDAIAQCTKCSLSETRTNTVPGQGNPNPEVMFIGEAPGADEDEQALAFVGRAGQLLTKMIIAMGLTRDEVFIANILKCRPPDNRKPTPEETELCIPYLKKQIALLKPKVIIALGATAIQGLLGDSTPITKIRGKWLEYKGVKVMPTFHPSYLLRNPPGAKKMVWDDLQEVMRSIGRPVSK